MSIAPVLSVLMITYNHQDYIEEAIKSVISQITSFPFHLIIGEDHSDDTTREICEKYASNNPNIITLLPPEKNIGMVPNMLKVLTKCTGKYVAICEGDDFWTDPHKLQKQVDFLEANPDYSLCFHNAKKVYHDEEREPELFGSYSKHVYSPSDIINEWLIPTGSVVFRNVFQEREVPEHFYHVPIGDFPLFLYLGEFGKYRYIDETMSVYRILLSGAVKSDLASEKYYLMSRKLSKILADYYKPKHKTDFAIRIAFDNYCLARFAARKGGRIKALSFLFQSIKAAPLMMFRNPKHYRYITLSRLFPKIILDIIKGKQN